MNQLITEVCDSLDTLSEDVLNAWSSDVTLQQNFGWNHPALTRQDLAYIPQALSNRIRLISDESISDRLLELMVDIPEKIEALTATTIPYMFNGNGVSAVPAYMATLDYVSTLFTPILDWEVLNDKNALPVALTRRLRAIKAQLEQISPEEETLRNQIKTINEATEAAFTLPTDLASLNEARIQVGNIVVKSAEFLGKIDTQSKKADEISVNLTAKETEAIKLVEQCEIAYRITTSKGLAGAFETRANALNVSIYAWVGGLIAALGGSIWIGTLRYAVLVAKLDAANPSWGIISIHLTLSVLALAAPVWFGWLATKQINQRFKLSEDYAYKSSVAKAYEGYRKEASSIDKEFVARLFGSALTRLEEAPLRLIGEEEHASPLQELLASKGFQKALETVPELRDSFAKLFNETVGGLVSYSKSGIGKVAKIKDNVEE
jgi:hypothetical protein